MIYLSVIIPTRNRANLLNKALTSLVNQTYPQQNFEVIVIDNGSTDNTKEIVESYIQLIPQIHYIFEPEPGLHRGRHAGLNAASGDILVYGDDDIEAFPTWLEGIAESFSDPSVALVGGNNLPRYESKPPEWVEQLWQKTPWGITNPHYSLIDFGQEGREISPYYVYGCNFSIRKKTLAEIGGFHPDSMPEHLLKYRGDGETAVSNTILKRGFRTQFNPKASVYHYVSNQRMKFSYLKKRGYLQGISDSYRDIRKKGSYNFFYYLHFTLLMCLAHIRRSLKFWLKAKSDPTSYYIQGYFEGYLFHQNAMTAEPILQEWVLKPNYLE